ncbi:MAG: type VI secretion system baseplate subunit TssG [Planctomycetes bacterium]|nr:type VI secretion system baseplate subunit TssG [Planctomycetota bacterium]
MPEGKTETTVGTSRGETLLDRILTRGWEFDFFQVVWFLERYTPDREPVGHRGPVSKEAFRFRPDISLGFPSTDVRRITAHDDPETGDRTYGVDVTFLGLYGVSTPMPLHYAIDMLRAVDAGAADPVPEPGAPTTTSSARRSDTTPARDFLDIFHHRLISLFYRAWLKYRYDMQFGMAGRDMLTDYLLWLVGCPRSFGESSVGIRPIRMIRYAGALTQHPKSALMLEGLLSDYWSGLEISVEQCVGRWVAIPAADMNQLGSGNSVLGETITIGEEVYDLNGAFNVVIGPVDWNTFQAFLPDGRAFAHTRDLVRLYCTDPLSFTIEVRLHPGEIPELELGVDPNAGRLGYTSWVRTDEVPETSVIFDSNSSGPLVLNTQQTEESAEADVTFAKAV